MKILLSPCLKCLILDNKLELLWWLTGYTTELMRVLAPHRKLIVAAEIATWWVKWYFRMRAIKKVLLTYEISGNYVACREIWDDISEIIKFWKVIVAAKKQPSYMIFLAPFGLYGALCRIDRNRIGQVVLFPYPQTLRWENVATYKIDCSAK